MKSFIEPPQGLYEKIIMRIHHEERVLVFRRIMIFSTTLAISILAFIPSLKMLLSDFSHSGFLSFFSLAFSDSSAIMAYWQSFAMILLETLPALSLALVLAIILTFLQSAKSLAKNIKIIKGRYSVAN
jgi:ABC-type spermidine/putrescine transport system permease subunit I